MKPTVKAVILNFFGFTPIYFISYVLLSLFTPLEGILIPVIGAVTAFFLAPKFQAIQHQKDTKIFMKWIFIKGLKEIK
jgi:hypothetical protein